MGDICGGSGLPAHNAGKGRGVLLAVLPWAEGTTDASMKQIQAEFPDLEVHYIHHVLTPDIVKRTHGEGIPVVPEGKASHLDKHHPINLSCFRPTSYLEIRR